MTIQLGKPGRQRRLRIAIGSGLSIAALLLLLTVDIFPIVTNDSLEYIGHSNSIAATGLVQLGYRQVGYPLFLAVVDTIATPLGLEPLLTAVVLQRLVYLSALALAVWLWRWRALPLIAVGVMPSFVAYTNAILTEGLGIGLTAWYAVLVAVAVRFGHRIREGAAAERTRTGLAVAGAFIGLIYLTLLVIRFQYVLMVFGLFAVLYVMYRAGDGIRVAAGVTALVVLVVASTFLVLLASENNDEFGVFVPSARGERSRFWATWKVTFALTPENRSNPDLAAVFGRRNPNNFMNRIDSLPSDREQQEAYVDAMDDLILLSGTTWNKERLFSSAGVLRGGRVDDMRFTVWSASERDPDAIRESIYWGRQVQQMGVEAFTDRYNDGRRIQTIILSPMTPVKTAPYFMSLFRWLLLGSLVVLVGGALREKTRLLSGAGLLTLFTTAAVFGYLLMDNVRFMILPLLFTAVTATGAADLLWRNLVEGRRAKPAPGTHSLESTGPGSQLPGS